MVTVLSSYFHACLFFLLVKLSSAVPIFFGIFDIILIMSGRNHQVVIYHPLPAVSQLVVSHQSLSLSRSSHLLLLLLLLDHYCPLFCFIRSLCLSLEDITFSLVEKWGMHQDLITDLSDLLHYIVVLYHRIIIY